MVKCKDCKYSLVNDGKRYCLRFPPAVREINPSGVGKESIYPEVEDNWRCGEGATE
jgi:hypothetical protein